MRTKLLLASLVLASCYHGGGSTPPPKTKSDVRVDLASINLGDDCGGAALIDASAKQAPNAGAPAGDMDISSAGSFACVQTTMQLQIMNNGNEPTSIRIKRVELLDASGKVAMIEPPVPT